MGRIAGNDKHYTFKLVRHYTPEGQPEVWEATEHGFALPSVTTILDAAMGKPAGAMAHWGYNLGVEGMLTLAQVQDLSEFTSEKSKEMLKEAGFSPNQVRDSAGDRGTNAHRALELLATGYEEQLVTGKRASYLNKTDGVMESIDFTPFVEGVNNWYAAEMTEWEVVGAEVPVWSITHGFCGTLDLIRRHRLTGALDILDLKTHKPKTQAFPAYDHDLLQLAAYRLGWQELYGQEVAQNTVLVVDDKGRYFTDTRQAPTDSFLAALRLYHVLHDLEAERKSDG